MSNVSDTPSLNQTPDSGRMNEVAGFASAAIDAMAPGAVAGIAKNVSNLVLLADSFATPEVSKLLDTVLEATPALTKLLSTVQTLTENGSIDKVLELLSFVRAIQDSANGALVTTVLSQITDLVAVLDDVTTSRIMDLVPAMLTAMDQAIVEQEAVKNPATLRQLFKQVRNPETLATFRFLLSFVQKLSPALKSE